MPGPDFLDLPARATKPRGIGLGLYLLYTLIHPEKF